MPALPYLISLFTGGTFVYVSFDNGNTWSEDQKLVAVDGAAEELFGQSVAVYGSSIAVGAYYDDNVKGTKAGIILNCHEHK